MSQSPKSPPSLAALALAAVIAGCGGADHGAPGATTKAESTQAHKGPAPEPKPRPATCPPDLANCEVASGRVVYVERVDPDGDGDAHFVLASAEEITGPGISVIDVERELRPHPLPGVGAELSAAGPVLRGSYGQRQIQAVELRVAR